MGWFSNKKSTVVPIDELSDKQIKEALKKGKVPTISPKEFKKMRQDEQRAMLGEKGLGAIRAAAADMSRQRQIHFEQQMRKDHAVERMKAADPRAYEKLLDREARRQGLL